MKELIVTMLIVGPLGFCFGAGWIIGHARGYNQGANMVLDRLQPTIKKLVGEEIWERLNREYDEEYVQ